MQAECPSEKVDISINGFLLTPHSAAKSSLAPRSPTEDRQVGHFLPKSAKAWQDKTVAVRTQTATQTNGIANGMLP